MEHLSIDLWAANLHRAPDSLATWLATVEARLLDAAARGVDLLVLPEFCCAQWLSFAPADLAVENQLGWLAETGQSAIPALQDMVARSGVALLPGTIPHLSDRAEGGFLNRAWFIRPDGQPVAQDKLSLTPLEAQGASGVTVAGTQVNVFEWKGLRCAIAICLDTEYTALWSHLGKADLDLVLIPAKTDMITGYNRVFGCARARAIELQTVVCCVGAVGAPLTPVATDTGVGGAGVFLPCDVSVSLDGVFAALPAQGAAAGTDPVLMAAQIPVGLCRRLRQGAAEAELRPALWRGDHLTLKEVAA